MTRLTFLAVVALALAALAPPAGAIDNNFFNWNTFRRFDYQETPTGQPWRLMYRRRITGAETTAALVPRDSNPRWCEHLLTGPPAYRERALPFAELWLYAVADTQAGPLPNKDTVAVVVESRWRTWYPGDYSRIYRGPWRTTLNITRPLALTYGPVIGSDTLGWFNDVEFRARGTALNDSSFLYLGVVRRTWK